MKTNMPMIMDEIANLDAAIEAANTERGDLLRDAAKHAPFKVGDILLCNGYGFAGKQMKVGSIYFKMRSGRGIDPYFTKPSWVAYGGILKKDGTVGTREGVHARGY